MKIIIPTRGRVNKQLTLESLPEELRSKVILVVPRNEERQHRVAYPLNKVVGLNYTTIGNKRQKIIELFGSNKMVMIDDDLRFRIRYGNKFKRSSHADIVRMFRDIESALDTHVHVGLLDEFACRHAPKRNLSGGRYNQVLAYNLGLLTGAIPKFRLAINEDHDFHFQLQSLGYKPLILSRYTKSSRAYAVGGCNSWRTSELEKTELEKFAALWPEIVTVSMTWLKTRSWFFKIRISWKELYGS